VVAAALDVVSLALPTAATAPMPSAALHGHISLLRQQI
jgi:hypothetical protein